MIDVAREVAQNPDRWRHLVRAAADGERVSEQLLLTEDVEIWLICWEPGHDTGFHDHDRSGGAVVVAQGAVREDRLVVGGEPPASRVVGEGEAFTFEPTDIHRVVYEDGEPAVTVHVYSPPLHAMGSYEVTEEGRLLRTALSATTSLSA
jgi:predicted metal-dependent enzyme (double-stranded beta helix superfamily)